MILITMTKNLPSKESQALKNLISRLLLIDPSKWLCHWLCHDEGRKGGTE